jgi:dTDP-4-dehydrorhamnose 3,5-epimerase
VIFTECGIAGAFAIATIPHADARGRFMRAWCAREFAEHGLEFAPVQANMGFSHRRGTVRGMHFQTDPAPEAKLVRCTRGRVFDVLVDMRPSSPTFRHWYGMTLSAEKGDMLFVPEHCAHGYQTLEDASEVLYQTSAFYAPDAVRGVRFDDPALDIAWPLPATDVSDQDRSWPLLQELPCR